MRLNNKVALITASTRGIGLACVKACAKEGATVFLAARNMELAQSIANRLNAAGAKVKCVYSDATKPETFSSMVEDVITDSGRIDILVNNFGISNPSKDLDFANTDPQFYLDTVILNLRSVFMASQAAAKHMAACGGGSIINISSVGGLVPDVSQVAYGTSKAAINYLTKLIAVHEAKNKIRCNAVLPGMTATEAVEKHVSEEFRDLFIRHIPLGRMGLPEEIAAAVVYLASDEAAYTTGQILTVSGGFGLATPVYEQLAGKREATPSGQTRKR
jgi:NAD(P)-dependent dehydrogenase (short-subunit alcohol dehydrogenase family)